MNEITKITASGVPLLLDDIDTDRIIPARFLRCVTFDGLGDHAFEDDREQDPSHPFNQSRYRNAGILVAGRNFGCGSSREHAPQSLMRWGIKGIVAESFAEIFFGNCVALGVAAVTADRADLENLAAAIEQDPTAELTLDLESKTVALGETTVGVEIPESAREALTTGTWDFLAQLLENVDTIEKRAGEIPYMNEFTAV